MMNSLRHHHRHHQQQQQLSTTRLTSTKSACRWTTSAYNCRRPSPPTQASTQFSCRLVSEWRLAFYRLHRRTMPTFSRLARCCFQEGSWWKIISWRFPMHVLYIFFVVDVGIWLFDPAISQQKRHTATTRPIATLPCFLERFDSE